MDIMVITGQVPATDVSIEYERWLNGVDPSDIIYTTSRHDLHAVEEAIRIRDSQKQSNITLIAIGPPRVEATLRSYLSMGADAAIHICAQSLEDIDAYGLSLALSRAIKNMKYDLIICGGELLGDAGCTFSVGPYVAEMLGVPHVSGITKIELQAEDQRVFVHRKIERGDREIIRCPLPCLLAVEMGINEPRYPTFPDSLASIRKDVQVIDIASVGLGSTGIGHHSSFVKFAGFSPPRGRVKKGLIIDTKLSAAERLKKVMSGGLSPKNGKETLLYGEPNKLAEEVTLALERKGIIRRVASS